MKIYSLIFIFSFLGLFTNTYGQKQIKVYETFDEIAPLFNKNNDSLYVINFWATWCKPCVAELPYFEALNEKYKNDPVKVILVSLDFKKHLERKVLPFIEKKNLKSEIVLLNDPKPTYWIDRVDESWSGAIPATLFYQGSKRQFEERDFENLTDLENIINRFLKT